MGSGWGCGQDTGVEAVPSRPLGADASPSRFVLCRKQAARSIIKKKALCPVQNRPVLAYARLTPTPRSTLTALSAASDADADGIDQRGVASASCMFPSDGGWLSRVQETGHVTSAPSRCGRRVRFFHGLFLKSELSRSNKSSGPTPCEPTCPASVPLRSTPPPAWSAPRPRWMSWSSTACDT